MQSAHETDRAIYEIRIRGHLEQRWQQTFDGMTIAPEANGTTHLVGPVVDQAALHAMLRKIRDLGMPLLLVNNLSANILSVHHKGDPQ